MFFVESHVQTFPDRLYPFPQDEHILFAEHAMQFGIEQETQTPSCK
jgi:hypothetical protein